MSMINPSHRPGSPPVVAKKQAAEPASAPQDAPALPPQDSLVTGFSALPERASEPVANAAVEVAPEPAVTDPVPLRLESKAERYNAFYDPETGTLNYPNSGSGAFDLEPYELPAVRSEPKAGNDNAFYDPTTGTVNFPNGNASPGVLCFDLSLYEERDRQV